MLKASLIQPIFSSLGPKFSTPKGKIMKNKGLVLQLLLAALLGFLVGFRVTYVEAQTENTDIVYYGCVNNNSGTIKVFFQETACIKN